MDGSDWLPRADRPLVTPTYDGSGQCVHPDVIRVGGAFYGRALIMAMEPYPYGDDSLENPSLLCSDDGLTWEIPSGIINPVVEPPRQAGAWNSDADLLLGDDGRLFLFYRRNSGRGETTFLRRWTTDGVSWQPEETIFAVEPSGEFASPAIVRRDGAFQLYFVDTAAGSVKHATSADALNWSSPIPLVRFPEAWHLDAFLNGNWTYILLNDRKQLFMLRTRDNSDWRVLCAEGWAAYRQSACAPQPILSPSRDSWDNSLIYRSSFLVERGTLRLWYGARSTENEWHIGYSEGRLPE